MSETSDRVVTRWPWTGESDLTLRQLLLAMVCASVIVLPLVVFELRHFSMPLDLAVYRLGGYKALHHVGDLYARGPDNAVYGRLLGPSFGTPHPFTYPPFAALVSVPLALLGPVSVTILWTALSMVLLTWITAVAFAPLLRRLPHRRWLAFVAILIVAGLITPVFETLFYGQVNLILVALCLMDCRFVRRRRGVLIGLATALKLLPGVFILYLAATRQWAAVVRAVVTTLVCFGVAAILLPHASSQYWTHFGADVQRAGGVSYYSNQSLNGLMHRLDWPAWLWLVASIAVLVLGLRRARLAHRQGAELAAVALVGITILLVSPISWQHHAVWIVIAIGVLVKDGLEPRRLVAAAGVSLVFLLRLPQWGAELASRGTLPLVAGLMENAYLVAYLILLATLPLDSGLKKNETAPVALESGPGWT